MEYKGYLVSFVQHFNSSNGVTYDTDRRAFVMAEDHNKAIEYVKKLIQADEKQSGGIISSSDYVASALMVQDILLDNGTFATKTNIFYRNNIIDRNEAQI